LICRISIALQTRDNFLNGEERIFLNAKFMKACPLPKALGMVGLSLPLALCMEAEIGLSFVGKLFYFLNPLNPTYLAIH
ncbi:MAG: hypothetical protein EA411_11375, partial [Saprospirales bacterium]